MNQKLLAAFAAVCISSVSVAADAPGSRPSDRKAREILEKVISIPTELGRGKVPEMAEYLAGEFRAAGFPADDITVLPYTVTGDKTAALIVRYRGTGKSGKKPIVVMAHMDVVTARRADWERDPYQLVEENGYFFGRGTADIKSGVTGLTATFLRLRQEGFKPSRDLIIYFSGDEDD